MVIVPSDLKDLMLHLMAAPCLVLNLMSELEPWRLKLFRTARRVRIAFLFHFFHHFRKEGADPARENTSLAFP